MFPSSDKHQMSINFKCVFIKRPSIHTQLFYKAQEIKMKFTYANNFPAFWCFEQCRLYLDVRICETRESGSVRQKSGSSNKENIFRFLYLGKSSMRFSNIHKCSILNQFSLKHLNWKKPCLHYQNRHWKVIRRQSFRIIGTRAFKPLDVNWEILREICHSQKL